MDLTVLFMIIIIIALIGMVLTGALSLKIPYYLLMSVIIIAFILICIKEGTTWLN